MFLTEAQRDPRHNVRFVEFGRVARSFTRNIGYEELTTVRPVYVLQRMPVGIFSELRIGPKGIPLPTSRHGYRGSRSASEPGCGRGDCDNLDCGDRPDPLDSDGLSVVTNVR